MENSYERAVKFWNQAFDIDKPKQSAMTFYAVLTAQNKVRQSLL